MKTIIGLLAVALTLAAQPRINPNYLNANIRYGTSVPAWCEYNQLFVKTDATAGSNLYACVNNAFVLQSAGVGDVTHTAGALTAGRIVIGNALSDIKVALASIDANGFPQYGIGYVAGWPWVLGNAGDTGASSLTVYSGDAANEPAWVRLLTSGGNDAYLFACGGVDGDLCLSTTTPGAVATNPVLTTDNAKTVSNKTLDNTNTFNGYTNHTAIAAPGTPAAGLGSVYFDSTSKNLGVKDDAGVVKHGVQTDTGAANNYISAISDAGAITKSRPACATLSDAGGGCSMSTTAGGDLSGTLPSPALANVPSGVTMAGSLLATAIAAPGTPASGKGSVYVDSTSKNLSVIDDAGVVKHGVQTKAAVATNFLTAISDAGVVAAAQPASTDLSDTANLVRNNASNTYSTGTQDMSAATAMIPTRGSGAPSSGTCDAAGEVGSIYIRSGVAGYNATEYICENTGASTYEWVLKAPTAGTGIALTPSAAGTAIAADTAVMLSNASAQSMVPYSCIDTGAADAAACNILPALAAYPTGTNLLYLVVTPVASNTTTTTLNVQGKGAKPIYKNSDGTNLAANDLRIGVPVLVKYDPGSNSGNGAFYIEGQLGNVPVGTGDITAVGDCTTGDCYQTATANYVYAGPATGAAAPAALRALVSADIPSNAANTSGNASTATALAADPAGCTNQFTRDINASGTATCASVAGTDFATKTANYIFAGPTSGGAATPDFRALVSADIPANAANTSGNAGTASALAADPSNCTSGSVAAGITAAGVAEGCIAATNANTASTIVQRDGSGNFTAGTITASLSGNASGSAATITGSLVLANTPLTARGDLFVATTATPILGKLAKGTQYQTLQGGAADPGYDAVHLDQATAVTGVLPLANLPARRHQYGGLLIPTTSPTTYFVAAQACTIDSWNILVDAGTATVKFWKIATGTALPTVANVINTSGVAISSGTAIHSTTVTDFTTLAVAAHDIGAVTITASATATFVYATVECVEN